MVKTAKRIAAAAAFLAITAVVPGTEAYLTDHDQKINSITVGFNDTEITEDFPEVTPVPPSDHPTFKKTVTVKNSSRTSNVDCYVRARISFSNSDIGKHVRLNGIDTSNWTLSEDGYYYYRKILAKGESTTPLLESVTIDASSMDEHTLDYVSDFSIGIYEESVQAEGYDTYESAWASYEPQA